MAGYQASAEKMIASMKKPLDLNQEKKRLPDVTDDFFWESLKLCYPYTLLSTEKLFNLYEATLYLGKRNISGSVVECGVFLGGAVMMVARAFLKLGITDRKIYLYDTFSGFLGTPSDEDLNLHGDRIGHQNIQNFIVLTEENLRKVEYPHDNYIFIEGGVEETLTQGNLIPDSIALLRLDTDTYSTTVIELEKLYPKLVLGGVLVLDDYGYSLGVKKAVDEYFLSSRDLLFFQRPNYSSRTAVKI
jgi:O-methyltransferase